MTTTTTTTTATTARAPRIQDKYSSCYHFHFYFCPIPLLLSSCYFYYLCCQLPLLSKLGHGSRSPEVASARSSRVARWRLWQRAMRSASST